MFRGSDGRALAAMRHLGDDSVVVAHITSTAADSLLSSRSRPDPELDTRDLESPESSPQFGSALSELKIELASRIWFDRISQ